MDAHFIINVIVAISQCTIPSLIWPLVILTVEPVPIFKSELGTAGDSRPKVDNPRAPTATGHAAYLGAKRNLKYFLQLYVCCFNSKFGVLGYIIVWDVLAVGQASLVAL